MTSFFASLLLALAPQNPALPPVTGGDGGVVIVIRSLDPLELQAAIDTPGPRTIQFAVGGVMDLQKHRFYVYEPHLTIDGSSAPEPGITMIRGGISIRTHDVKLRHLRVRPGDAGEAQGSGWEPDGIGLFGPAVTDVLIEHCSISWAVDENLAVSSSHAPTDSPQRITIRDCIVSEALDLSSHSEGPHSRGFLVRGGHEVTVERCLFAHNARRNPVIRDGASGTIVNNLIYNPGTAAIHLAGGHASIVGNVLLFGPDTNPELVMVMGSGSVEVRDNLALDMQGEAAKVIAASLGRVQLDPRIAPVVHASLAAKDVEAHVLLHAGARPSSRDEIDQRIVDDVVHRTGAIIDSQDDVGGYP